MRFVAVFNGLLALNIGGKLLLDLAQHTLIESRFSSASI